MNDELRTSYSDDGIRIFPYSSYIIIYRIFSAFHRFSHKSCNINEISLFYLFNCGTFTDAFPLCHIRFQPIFVVFLLCFQEKYFFEQWICNYDHYFIEFLVYHNFLFVFIFHLMLWKILVSV